MDGWVGGHDKVTHNTQPMAHYAEFKVILNDQGFFVSRHSESRYLRSINNTFCTPAHSHLDIFLATLHSRLKNLLNNNK